MRILLLFTYTPKCHCHVNAFVVYLRMLFSQENAAGNASGPLLGGPLFKLYGCSSCASKSPKVITRKCNTGNFLCEGCHKTQVATSNLRDHSGRLYTMCDSNQRLYELDDQDIQKIRGSGEAECGNCERHFDEVAGSTEAQPPQYRFGGGAAGATLEAGRDGGLGGRGPGGGGPGGGGPGAAGGGIRSYGTSRTVANSSGRPIMAGMAPGGLMLNGPFVPLQGRQLQGQVVQGSVGQGLGLGISGIPGISGISGVPGLDMSGNSLWRGLTGAISQGGPPGGPGGAGGTMMTMISADVPAISMGGGGGGGGNGGGGGGNGGGGRDLSQSGSTGDQSINSTLGIGSVGFGSRFSNQSINQQQSRSGLSGQSHQPYQGNASGRVSNGSSNGSNGCVSLKPPNRSFNGSFNGSFTAGQDGQTGERNDSGGAGGDDVGDGGRDGGRDGDRGDSGGEITPPGCGRKTKEGWKLARKAGKGGAKGSGNKGGGIKGGGTKGGGNKGGGNKGGAKGAAVGKEGIKAGQDGQEANGGATLTNEERYQVQLGRFGGEGEGVEKTALRGNSSGREEGRKRAETEGKVG